MRCEKCGWPNKPSETHCVKCHAPLISEEDSDLNNINSNHSSDERLNKTVSEEEAFGSHNSSSRYNSNEETVAEPKEASKPCPKCGYPLRPGTEKCPNCKFQIIGSSQSSYSPDTESKKKSNPVRRATRMDIDDNNLRGTVNPYMMDLDIEPSFILKPIKRSNERHELEEREYEGKSVTLNRNNTEEKNASITSREQAIITQIDGRWYIEDKSEQRTTFVQAAKRIELSDGDLILLGNRLFEFRE